MGAGLDDLIIITVVRVSLNVADMQKYRSLKIKLEIKVTSGKNGALKGKWIGLANAMSR
jgi:hypothetical protein